MRKTLYIAPVMKRWESLKFSIGDTPLDPILGTVSAPAGSVGLLVVYHSMAALKKAQPSVDEATVLSLTYDTEEG